MLLCYIIFHLICCFYVYKTMEKLFPGEQPLYKDLLENPESGFLFLLSMVVSPLMAFLLWIEYRS